MHGLRDEDYVNLLNCLLYEMKETTVDSIDPWMPVGGVCEAHIRPLPANVSLKKLCARLRKDLTYRSNASIKKVTIKGETATIYVRPPKDITEELRGSQGVILPAVSLLVAAPFTGVQMAWVEQRYGLTGWPLLAETASIWLALTISLVICGGTLRAMRGARR